VLPLIHRHEVEAVGKYLEQEKSATEPDIKAAFASIIPDEVSHEIEILESIKAEDTSPGSLRSIVLGANDGLGSVLALVAGVAGAVASSTIVLVAGVAGLVAGAVSMALSNYISVKSEREGRDARVVVQRIGIERAGPAKLKQLEHLLETRGLSSDEARPVAERLSHNREEFLKSILREGYGLGDASFEQPGRLALYTGVAFLIAGAIPVIPFFFLPPTEGLIAAVVMSALALFLAGVLKSLITLGKMLKSGLEMLAIGLGSAAATYVVGLLIGQYGL
jgi:VIT1/CCC1 family predicted Fe2+/Mn2+ transporter